LQHWSGAVTCPASHDGSSVNGFLPTPIRGELSYCRALNRPGFAGGSNS